MPGSAPLERYHEAQKIAAEVDQLNSSTVKLNRERKARNKAKRAEHKTKSGYPTSKRIRVEPMLPMPHAYPDWVKEVLEAEQHNRAHLAHRTGAEWRVAIMALDPDLRWSVGSVVWWDYFGNRGGAPDHGHRGLPPWDNLNDVIAPKNPHKKGSPYTDLLAPKVIERGLVLAGYSPAQAAQRMIAQ